MATVVLPLALLLPVLGTCLLIAFARVLPRVALDVFALTVVLAELGLLAVLAATASDGRLVQWSGGWHPSGTGLTVGIALVADGTGVGLALLIAVLTGAAMLFGWHYFEEVHAHYRSLLLLFATGMIGFALAGDLFTMFVFFELMGATAYALTGFHVEEAESVQAGFTFGVVNSLGAYLTLIGVGLLYARTGQLNLAALGSALPEHDPAALAAFALVSIGWLVKAAAVPFHFWLADAHAAAPSPVCVLFSAVMAPLGVYGVARVYWAVFPGVTSAHTMLLVLGCLTAVLGAILCFTQQHVKRMLAYSTIAHIGMFLIGLSTLDGPAALGTGLYLAGHAGAKGTLFFVAGILLSRHGSMNEAVLHGKARNTRGSAVLWFAGGLALAGLPPFGTALGKDVLDKAQPSTAVLLALVSAVTAAAILRAGLRIFLGAGPVPEQESETTTGQDEEPDTGETLDRTPVTMLVAAICPLVVCLAVGVVPAIAHYASEAAATLTDHDGYVGQVLLGRVTALVPVEGAHWSFAAVAFGLVTAVVAVVIALLAVYADRIPRAARKPMVAVRPALHVLHRVHSGQTGDYAAWMTVGAALVAALLLA